jgi:hypothetical protein
MSNEWTYLSNPLCLSGAQSLVDVLQLWTILKNEHLGKLCMDNGTNLAYEHVHEFHHAPKVLCHEPLCTFHQLMAITYLHVHN